MTMGKPWVVALGAVLAGGLAGDSAPGTPVCRNAPSRIVIGGPAEPGQKLRVRGRVVQPDGQTPAAGVTVYAYHTDATGVYSRERGAPPRLRGFMTTDADGLFEYLTIRPEPYPTRTVPAHVHHQLWGGGWPPQWSEDLLFDDDPLVGPKERARSAELGRFGAIRRLTRADGTLETRIELRLKPEGDRFEMVIRHGLEACGVEPVRRDAPPAERGPGGRVPLSPPR
jgi:protocatechuate 3,4-dioxygenase beta subunit